MAKGNSSGSRPTPKVHVQQPAKTIRQAIAAPKAHVNAVHQAAKSK